MEGTVRIRGWWKREVALGGRYRMAASLLLFWGPIFVTAILLLMMWLGLIWREAN